MIVYVVVSLFQGVFENVDVFKSQASAYRYMKKVYGDQGVAYIESCKTGDTSDYEDDWEEADTEIHLFVTKLR